MRMEKLGPFRFRLEPMLQGLRNMFDPAMRRKARYLAEEERQKIREDHLRACGPEGEKQLEDERRWD